MGKKHQEGFTLIELLVLMMVLAIALGIGVPAMFTMAANTRMAAAANDIVSSMVSARSEASTRRRPVTLCASSNWNSEQPDCSAGGPMSEGWIVFQDTDADGIVDADERPVLQTHGPLDGRVHMIVDSGPPDHTTFLIDGLLWDIPGSAPSMRNIQLCDDRGNRDTGGGRAAGRWIAISPTGRPVLHDTVAHLQGTVNPLGGC